MTTKSWKRDVEPSQKVILQAPTTLIARADHAAQELQITRSKFVRVAIEEKLKRLEDEQLAQDIREGFAANAEYYNKITEQFLPRPTH
ncbi:MAG: hypothetical protein Q7R67_00795 [bacterium]|nr:hypothetical protein [bacterium]